MARRLGIFLYWIGWILAMAWVLLVWMAVFDSKAPSSVGEFALMGVPALALFLLGKGLRYVLSGY